MWVGGWKGQGWGWGPRFPPHQPRAPAPPPHPPTPPTHTPPHPTQPNPTQPNPTQPNPTQPHPARSTRTPLCAARTRTPPSASSMPTSWASRAGRCDSLACWTAEFDMKKHKQAWVAWSREVTGTRRAHGCGWARLQQLRACRGPRDTPTLLAWLIGFLSRNVNNLMVQVAHQLLHTRYTDHSLDTQPTAHNLAEGGGGVSASWRHPCCHASSYARPDVRGTRKGCCSGSAPAGAAPGFGLAAVDHRMGPAPCRTGCSASPASHGSVRTLSPS